jgi:hypothetical protein
MIIEHEKKETNYNLACGYLQRCTMKQSANHEPLHIELWLEHGCYHVRAHDLELHGRIDWSTYDNLTCARYKFAELKRNIKSAMSKNLFNLTGE